MSSFSRRLATVVSWLGHPLVFISISVAIVLLTQLSLRAAVLLLLIVFLAVVLPMAVLLFLGVRSGRWKDIDVSVREDRKRFYPVAIPISGAGTVITWLAGAPGYIVRGGIITFILLIVAAVVNLRFKISLHMLFAAYCAVVLLQVNTWCGSAALILAAMVFWSRLVLTRHTVAETAAGSALGALGGFAAAWM